MTLEERLARVRDLYEFHAPGGCGADIPGPYDERAEAELLKSATLLRCATCTEATFPHPRSGRTWFRHATF